MAPAPAQPSPTREGIRSCSQQQQHYAQPSSDTEPTHQSTIVAFRLCLHQSHCAAAPPALFSLCCSIRFEKLAHSKVSSGSQDDPGSNKDVPSIKNADDAQKSVLVEAEVQRMKRHPVAGSAYAADRLKVLNKMVQLLGKVRTSTEGEELELLFANLNF